MKPYGCTYCNDLRNIQPAKYIAAAQESNRPIDADDELRSFVEKAKEEKQFLLLANDGLHVVDKCPECGYKFDEEDYDSYD